MTIYMYKTTVSDLFSLLSSVAAKPKRIIFVCVLGSEVTYLIE